MTDNRTHSFSDGSTKVAKRLVVHRDIMNPRAWVLSWDFGDMMSVGTEGECSRQYFRTAREGKRYAALRYNERAILARNW